MLFTTRFKPIWLTALALAGAGPATQPTEVSDPFPGVHYTHEMHQNPTASLHIFTIDLTNPNISIHVSRGGEPPDKHWQTTLMSVPKIAERDHLDLAINGDYFSAEQAADPDAGGGLAALINRGYRQGQRANVMGSAVTDGVQWATGAVPRPTMMVGADGKVTMTELTKIPPGVMQALSGNIRLIGAGHAEGHRGTERSARTAIGLDKANHTLTILVVDALWEGKASGISMPDLVKEMARLGCWYAINLDGGGSTTLIMRDAEGKLHTLNHPADGKPRPVAEVLGIVVKKGATPAGDKP